MFCSKSITEFNILLTQPFFSFQDPSSMQKRDNSPQPIREKVMRKKVQVHPKCSILQDQAHNLHIKQFHHRPWPGHQTQLYVSRLFLWNRPSRRLEKFTSIAELADYEKKETLTKLLIAICNVYTLLAICTIFMLLSCICATQNYSLGRYLQLVHRFFLEKPKHNWSDVTCSSFKNLL